MTDVSSNARPDAWASRWRRVDPGGPAGSSRPTSPRSTATSTASALTSLVTDAHGCATSRDPRSATSPSRSRSATPARPAPHVSAAASTSRSRTRPERGSQALTGASRPGAIDDDLDLLQGHEPAAHEPLQLGEHGADARGLVD